MQIDFKSIKFKIFNSYIISTVSITLVLLTFGLFALFFFNTKQLSNSAKENIIISVILKPDAEQGQVDELVKNIAIADYTKDIKLITPDEALEDLKMTLGDDIADVLEHNPLPTTININPKVDYSNTDSLQLIKSRLLINTTVDDVFYNRSMVYQLDKNVKNISFVLLVLDFFLILMAITLISNTIRLMIHSKRFEIKTMQLVGATKMFILKPFIIKSFLHGLLSSLLSIAIIIAAVLIYQNKAESIIKVSYLEAVFGLILLAGLIITFLATYFSVNSYLKSKTEELY